MAEKSMFDPVEHALLSDMLHAAVKSWERQEEKWKRMGMHPQWTARYDVIVSFSAKLRKL